MKFQRGVVGYARVMRLLLDEPRTSLDVAQAFTANPGGIRHMLRGLHKERLIHVERWVQPAGRGGRGCWRAVWAVGDEPNAPAPITSRGRPSLHPAQEVKPPRHPLVEIMAFAEMWRQLQQGPIGCVELASYMGTTRASIYRVLRELRRLDLAHIAQWERRERMGGSPTPLWALGFDKRNADRPRVEHKSLAQKRYVANRKSRELTMRIGHVLAGTASNLSRFEQTEAA